MKIAFTWYVPDTITIADPDKQGPLVGTRAGVAGVVVSVPWALKGVAEDGTTEIAAMTTPLAAIDPTDPSFKPFDKVTAVDLASWLFSAPDGTGTLSKADQERQLTDRILAKASPATPAKLVAQPKPAA